MGVSLYVLHVSGGSVCWNLHMYYNQTNNSHNADNADIFGGSFEMTCYYQSIVNINIWLHFSW